MVVEEALFSKYGREYPAGTVLFRQGDAGKEMYVIHAGLVAVSKRVRHVEKVLAVFGPGEFFGEMAIISARPRSATAVVVENAKCLVIDAPTFESMIRASSEIAVRMIKKLAERLEQADLQIENLLLRDPRSRLVHYLSQAAESRGSPDPEGRGIRVPLSLATLPATLGVARPELEAVFERLGRAGIALLQPDGALIPDLTELRELLDYLEKKEKFADI